MPKVAVADGSSLKLPSPSLSYLSHLLSDVSRLGETVTTSLLPLPGAVMMTWRPASVESFVIEAIKVLVVGTNVIVRSPVSILVQLLSSVFITNNPLALRYSMVIGICNSFSSDPCVLAILTGPKRRPMRLRQSGGFR